jgi:hypothetical protein
LPAEYQADLGCLEHGFQSRPDVIKTTATNIPAALGCEQVELLVPDAVRHVLPPEGLLVLPLEFGSFQRRIYSEMTKKNNLKTQRL